MRPADLTRLVLLAAIWGGSFLFVRMAAGAIGPMWLTELRVGLAAVAMLIYARAAGFDLNLAQNWRPYLVLGVLNTALPWALYASSGKSIGASYMAILNAAAPWFAAIGPKPTSSATPSMPSASPRILRQESVSPSQIAPQRAANQGAAALSMAMYEAPMYLPDQAYRPQGNAELSTPSTR